MSRPARRRQPYSELRGAISAIADLKHPPARLEIVQPQDGDGPLIPLRDVIAAGTVSACLAAIGAVAMSLLFSPGNTLPAGLLGLSVGGLVGIWHRTRVLMRAIDAGSTMGILEWTDVQHAVIVKEPEQPDALADSLFLRDKNQLFRMTEAESALADRLRGLLPRLANLSQFTYASWSPAKDGFFTRGEWGALRQQLIQQGVINEYSAVVDERRLQDWIAGNDMASFVAVVRGAVAVVSQSQE